MEERQLLATFVVTNTADSGTGSLRDALLQANSTAGANVINFNITGSGVHTITPTTALPKITAQVTIDGSSQPGFTGTPLIELDGINVTSADGLHLAGGNSTVKDLVINRFGGNGIHMDTAGGDLVVGCYIGTDPTGTIAEGNNGAGISIGSYNNTVGGTTAATRNVVSGNKSHGVHFDGAFSNAAVTNDVVEGNYIGVSANGSQPLGNSGNGVDFFGGSLCTIGGTAPGAGNVISNNSTGIKFFAGGSGTNLVEGNFIGTDPTGSFPMGNTFDGINVQSANAVTIGGTVAGAGNVISANKGNGIAWFGTQNGEVVQGNKIGVDITGTLPLGNLGKGISEFAGTTQSTIGGTAPGAGNIVAYNGATFSDAGIDIASGTGIAILSNSVFSNVAIGINLAATGDPSNKVTANTAGGPHTGPNDLQNYPVLTSVAAGGGHTLIQGTFNSTPNHTFLLQFFSNPTADPTGFGEGQTLLGSTTVNTDGTGNTTFNVNLPTGAPVGSFVSSTATDTTVVNAKTINDTSEFSQDVQVTQAPVTDLAVGISAMPEPVTVGGTLTYTVTVTNGGPDGATGVVLTDNLPSNATFISATPSQGTFSRNGNTITVNFGTVASGAAPTLTVQMQAPSAGTLTDSASVTGNEIDSNAANNTTSHNTVAQFVADLAVSMVANPEPAKTNRPLTYTVTVANNGPDTSTGSTLTDTLPSGVTFVSASVSQGTFSQNGGTVTAHFGPIANGGTAVLTITVMPTVTGQITNFASVTGNETDPTGADDSISHITQVVAPVADLAVTLSAAPEPVNVGSNLTYTLTVSNSGPDSATSVVLTDTLPAGATFVSATPTQGSATQSNGTVTANLGTLANGATATVTVIIKPATPGTATNAVNVAATESDPSSGNNSVSHDTTVNDIPGTLGFSAATSTVNEDAGTATITVTRSTGTLGTVSVQYATSDGTAKANVNYTPASGTLTFGPGETTKTFTIPILDDKKPLGNQTINLTLSSPTGGATLGTAAAVVTIKEVDRSKSNGDFDGDGKVDLSVYRTSTAQWLILRSTAGGQITQFGDPSQDIPVPGDYDGDGKTDLAVFRPSTAQWIVLRSTAGPEIVTFGAPNLDRPVPADFDGDGKTDLAVYRPTTGQWLVLRSTAGPQLVSFGAPNLDMPVPADYDGDGKADFAVYRPTTAQWLILRSTAGPEVVSFGAPGLDVPIPSDFDGDGKTDIAVYRPTTGQWLVLRSTAGPQLVSFGAPNLDIPIPADFDGDGKADFAVFRSTTAQWLILRSTAGPEVVTFGGPGLDYPLITPLAYRYKPAAGRVQATRSASLATSGTSSTDVFDAPSVIVPLVQTSDTMTSSTGTGSNRSASRIAHDLALALVQQENDSAAGQAWDRS